MLKHDENYAGRKIRVLEEIIICSDGLNYKSRIPHPPGSILTIASWRPEGFTFPEGMLFKWDFGKVELLQHYQQCRKCGTIYRSDIPVKPYAHCIAPNCDGLAPYEELRQDELREELKKQN